MRGERHPCWFGCGPETFLLSEAGGTLVFLHEGGSEDNGVRKDTDDSE